jgi:hypothetical protein
MQQLGESPPLYRHVVIAHARHLGANRKCNFNYIGYKQLTVRAQVYSNSGRVELIHTTIDTSLDKEVNS